MLSLQVIEERLDSVLTSNIRKRRKKSQNEKHAENMALEPGYTGFKC